MKRTLLFSITATALSLQGFAASKVTTSKPEIKLYDDNIIVSFDLRLDSLKLGANHQLYISPAIVGPDDARQVLPTVLINGRNMQYAYERGSIKPKADKNYNIATVVRRLNGKQQSVAYKAETPFRKWMLSNETHLEILTDSCGCGAELGHNILDARPPFNLNPFEKMTSSFQTPAVTELPVSVHEGRARVQFEVDRTVLHVDPYVCRNGQHIDNRRQIQVIDDSISYALSDPNVEIASINICGYASPESPYLHNEELSTGRSRALAEYIAKKYNLPTEKCTYSAVPENWKEFRMIVEKAPELTETQRADLLELIDRPCYGPSDYDAKERELKTDKKFASLYKSLILPKWFPELRATEFRISTRLKPMDDQRLAEIIKISPEKMSLNQMMRVARLYDEGSEDFNNAIKTALNYYPEDKTANLNAAVAAMRSGKYDEASKYADKAGDSPEAENIRGILETRLGNFENAKSHFQKASELPEARSNSALLP